MPKTNVTAAVVARHAGVSKWTVIRAFQKDSPIASDTREKVMYVAKQFNYEPNLLARSLAKNKTHQVAILVDDFTNPFMLAPLGHIAAKLQLEGLLSVLVSVNDQLSHNNAIRSARQRRLDAIVSFGVSFNPKLITEEMVVNGAPIFVFARESTEDRLPSVFTDPVISIENLSQHLLDRGYRRPIFFSGPITASTSLRRRLQYATFWKKHGVEEIPEVSSPVFDLDVASDVIRRNFQTLADRRTCDVLLCENDLLAIAAINILKYERGLSVPRDIAVVGFDDIGLVAGKAYDLTTVRQPYEKMVDELIDMVVGRKPIGSIAIPGQLVIRRST